MSKEKDIKKVPFKVFSKKGLTAFALAGVMLSTPFALAGCGEAGPKGDTGATGATGSNGKSAYELAVENGFTGTVQEWLESLKGNAGNSVVSVIKTATNGLVDTYTITFSDGSTTTFDVTNGADGGIGPQGPEGPQGDDGEAGTSVYVGYDGYLWNGAERTEYQAINAVLDKNVFENAIGIQGVMNNYYPGKYISLASDTVALMANYMPNASMAQYGNTFVTEIKVVAEDAGKLYIGTAKVADIVDARLTGSSYDADMQEYDVVAGVNIITLDLNVAQDETIVLGGHGSVGLYMTSDIPVNDVHGNFALIDGQCNADIISNNGTYADTLAVQVTALSNIIEEKALFGSNVNNYKASSMTVMSNSAVYPYRHSTNHYAGKTISKIGVPIIKMNSYTADQTFTLYVAKETTVTDIETNYEHKYTLTIPANTYASTAPKVYHYFDLSELNVVLEDDETLYFGSSTDTIKYGYVNSESTTKFNLITGAGVYGGTNLAIFFDIYTADRHTYSDHVEVLKANERVAELSLAIGTKNKLSIMGDSISTYEGWSNNATEVNSTMGENAVCYPTQRPLSSVDATWWKQTADKVGMSILVNNSIAGGDVLEDTAQSQAVNLHDNIGENAGTNPDIVAIYMGINDINKSANLTNFTNTYAGLVQTIKTTYGENVKIFLFTHVPNRNGASDSDVKPYNAAIKNIAETNENCYIVDLYKYSGITEGNCSLYMTDAEALHPNEQGMKMIADVFFDALYDAYVTNTD